jgi:glycosyltransferase involved in cell wall biosynthesis
VKLGFDVLYVERWERVEEVAIAPPPQVSIIKAKELTDLPKRTALVYTSLPAPDYNQIVEQARQKGIPVHYDIYDHWESMFKEQHFTWYNPDWESWLIRNATSCSCVSPTLKAYFKAVFKVDIPVIPNAADPLFWKEAADAPKEAVAVYIGTLGKQWEWVNHHAIIELAKQFPHYTFKVIGGYLKYTPPENVIQYGQVPHDALPKLVKGARIGLVPFNKCGSAYYCDPIKAWEYLAAKCIVAVTNVPAWRGMPNTVYREGDDAVKAMLDAFFVATTKSWETLPFGFWRDNCWMKRAKDILEVAGVVV